MNTTATPKKHQSDTKIVSFDTTINSATKSENLTIPSEKKVQDVSKLEFVRLKIPRLIPIALIEAVKGRTFTPEQFIKYQEQQIDNPGNFLYALIDSDKKIQGYLWAELNMLDNTLFISTFSIAKSFWGKGAGIQKAIEFVATLKKKTKSPRVLWCSTNEKFFIKHGFRRAKQVLMEYNSK
jgi:hypothetical protein